MFQQIENLLDLMKLTVKANAESNFYLEEKKEKLKY